MNNTWYRQSGPDGFIAISSRIRIARNLEQYPFPHKLGVRREELLNDCQKIASQQFGEEYTFQKTETMPALDRQMLVEKRIISPDLANNPAGCAVLHRADECASVMFNEEDHLRIQAVSAGFNLSEAYQEAARIESIFSKEFKMAFSDKLGYLTCCPTNLGTGLRASVMLHLPALTQSGQIEDLLSAVRRMGIAVRGMYGENSQASGNLYQVSNQVTLGLSEDEIITKLTEIIRRIIEKERETRKAIYNVSPEKLEDSVWRAYGIIQNARIISSGELLQYLSNVRLGADLGVLPVKCETLNALTVITQPAHIAVLCGETSSAQARDIKRAEVVRQLTIST